MEFNPNRKRPFGSQGAAMASVIHLLSCGLVWFVALGLLSSGRVIAGDQPPVVQFADSSKAGASFSWAAYVAGTATVLLTNVSDRDQTVTISISDSMSDQSKDPKKIFPLLDVAPASMTIPAHGARFLVLHATDLAAGSPEPISYSAVVTVQVDQLPSATVSLLLSKKSMPLQAALTKLTFVATREFPFIGPYWNVTFPVPTLNATAPESPPAVCAIIGYLASDLGDMATVRLADTPTHTQPDGTAHITVSGLAAGTFEGNVSFDPTPDRKNPVSIRVVSQDCWIYPVITMAIGIIVAFIAKRYLGVRRVIWVMQRSEAELGGEFAKAQAEVADTIRGTGVGMDSIAEDVKSKRAAVRNNIEALASPWIQPTIDENNDHFKAVIDGMNAIRGDIRQWVELEHEGISLNEALREARSSIRRVPGPKFPFTGTGPEMFADVTPLMMGRNLTHDTLPAHRNGVAAATSLVQAWSSANEGLNAAQEALDHVHNTGGAHAVWQEKLDTLRAELWTARVPDAIKVVTEKLHALKSEAKLTPKPLRPLSQLRVQNIFGTAFTEVDFVRPLRPHEEEHPAGDTQRALMATRAIQAGDWWNALWAGALALVTGLGTYYFDKPFGTIADYATLFAWAAGTKILVDVFAAFVDRFAPITAASKAAAAPDSKS